ncbi:alpha-ketoglutarate dehydrogenase [Pseudomonas fluorescens]|nr:alpha-ketoglutarate dehydrogenase [Pseudomonas fluorescens]MBD8175185.1 alpha-ketoglutarate dehydrogenase [Pseudomonas fluorescens]MBD8743641.1 alpha-ketoglutarate dehydrogenase [Pseudomonas fluorescens]MBD8759559.1 alpha-ketoglutarate dehydrogenase [Pseudomonas fluorescens]MBD8763793.1 alpha-ketoglutarate dehydrogenase [Pseudomonas fluorescens]
MSDIAAATDDLQLKEWCESLLAVIQTEGVDSAKDIMDALAKIMQHPHIGWKAGFNTPYINTIDVKRQPAYPGDLATEERLASIMRWNALTMVVRANKAYGELGGHISSYASAADLFEVGFNHFFHAASASNGGDLVFYQPHSAPGVYARAFLEGRLSDVDLDHYRQEITARKTGAKGLSSYPHPWLMEDFWQFPTGSMGIGPITSIYQARFMRYLQNRKLLNTEGRTVWGVFGDGEMDEPESMSALTLAAREGLDNLVWVINCNLQRLDGPVRGNGRIVDELEALFKGAGWNVVKLLWGSDWDGLFARDTDEAIIKAFNNTVDGQLQTFAAKDGHYNREHFFGQNEQLKQLAQGLTDEQIDRLKRGGHDMVKIYAAYAAALKHKGQPTVILAQTKKGYGMGEAGQGKMTTHQQKKLNYDDLIGIRNRANLPISDTDVEQLAYYKPSEDSPEMKYLRARRDTLGGYVPTRLKKATAVSTPNIQGYGGFALEANNKEMSTTMAFVRMLSGLLKDKDFARRIVPIVADEARTFGMASLFKQIGIYSSVGQRYEPEDIDSLLSYREATDGQILEEGISEAGAISSWVSAATSYSVHGVPMLPFYIYYSMFGFQRIGDLIWAAADQRARGFLLGATAGRTTLGGEGLQHQDGSSHVMAALIPNCRAYDPAFAGELAVIIDHGMKQMLENDVDEFYYITLMNENYAQPSLPATAHEDVLRGMYLYSQSKREGQVTKVRLLGSGTILREVIAAADILESKWNIAAEVWSVTSFSELTKEAREVERWNKLNPTQEKRASHVEMSLPIGSPVIAATDYVRAFPALIAPHVKSQFVVLGTDGFGRSDTREALRDFFEVSAAHIVLAAVTALADEGKISRDVCQQVIDEHNISASASASWSC